MGTGVIGDEIDLNDVDTSGMYRVQKPKNGAYDYGQLLVIHGYGDTIAQVCFDYAANRCAVRCARGLYGASPKWEDWTAIALCAAPEVHELPLASDCIATEVCYYYRTQENICHVKFAVAHSSGTIPPDDFLVATLPEGFRPKENIWRPAFGLTNRTLADAFANAHIYTDGKIIIDGASVTIQSAWFDFDFVAQS